MAKRRTFAAALISLVCAFVLVFSLGLMTACGNDETASGGSETAETVGGAWYYGAALPSNALGVSGDYYLNTTTLLSYVKDGQVWRLAASGEAGTWYHGTTAPDGNEGTEGDFYLNVQTGDLYQKKSDGWGQPILTLKGEKGRDGVIWFSGEGEPGSGPNAPQDAMKGDFYIDTTTWKVYQYQADKTWEELGSIRGEDAKDAVQFFNGNGEPSEEITAKANEGDLYLGQFSGLEEEGALAGSKLYRYLHGEWVVLMESMTKNQINIYTYEDLVQFRTSVANGTDYTDKEVHLKTDLTFTSPAGASLRKARAVVSEAWTPIGTQTHPFDGTFDGEGHVIENFTTQTTESATAVGFFGYVDGATIEHLHFEGANVTVSGSGTYGAVVVGQATGNVTVKDVTVTGSTVTATEGAEKGSLVGKSDGTVAVEKVEVEVVGSKEHASGSEGTDLVGSGNVTFTGKNEIEYPISDGFVEKHYKNDSETSIVYEISNLNGLKSFRDSVNGTGEFTEIGANTYLGKTVALADKIDLGNEPWIPIGYWRLQSSSSYPYFAGTFDGNHKTISNLTVDRSHFDTEETGSKYNDTSMGLFGWIKGATLKDLVIENANVKNWSQTGLSGSGDSILAAVGYGTIDNVDISGFALWGGSYVGAILGRAEGGTTTVTNCDLTAKKDVTTWVLGESHTGGVVGWTDENSVTVSKCTISDVQVEIGNGVGFSLWAINAGVGGIMGHMASNTTISECTLTNVEVDLVTTSVSYDSYGAGAVAGTYQDGANNIKIENCTGNVTVKTGNVDFYLNNGIIGSQYALKGNGSQVPELSGNTVEVIWNGFGRGEDGNWHVAGENPAKAFSAFRAMVNTGYSFAGETVILDKNVDLKDVENWEPIGTNSNKFEGTFDGQNKTISNLKIQTTTGYVGLFGVTGNVSLRNVAIDGATVTLQGDNVLFYIGVFVGKCGSGSISNVKVSKAEVNGNSTTGQYIGAITGWTYASISDCYAEFKVSTQGGSGQNAQVGGIVGQCYGDISRCYAKVDLHGNSIGGIVGFFHFEKGGQTITLSDCYATGSIDAVKYQKEKCPIYSGGLLGCTFSPNVKVVNNYFDGTISEFARPFIGASAGDDNDPTEELVLSVFERNGWSDNLAADQPVQGYQGKIQIEKLERSAECSFTSGMSYEAFLAKLAELGD